MISIIILLVFVMITLIYYSINYVGSYDQIYVLGIIGLLQYIFSIYSWKLRKQEIISPYIILLTAIYIFQCGQIILYVLPLTNYTPGAIGYLGITVNDYYSAIPYTLILLAFFHIGALSYLISKSQYHTVLLRNPYISPAKRRIQLKTIRTISFIVFAISFYPYFSTLVEKAINSMTEGYGILYSEPNAVGFGHLKESLGGYFIPSYICLLIGCKSKNAYRYILYAIGIITCCIILMTGSRTYAVLIMAVLLIYQNYFVRRYTKKQLFIIAFCGLFALNLLTIIKEVRGADKKSLDTFITHKTEDNAVIEALDEMGSSITCTIKMMQIVPDQEDWFYGKTYLYSLLGLVPNLGFWDYHPSRDYGLTDVWLTRKLNVNYGVGSSMAAEAYLNFGDFGFILFFIYGFIAAVFFGELRRSVKNGDYIKSIIIMMIFWFCLTFPRYPFMTTFRGIIFYALPIYLIIRYRYKSKLNHLANGIVNSQRT